VKRFSRVFVRRFNGTAQELKVDLSSFILEALDLDGNEFLM
jgi:hypothetical protein